PRRRWPWTESRHGVDVQAHVVDGDGLSQMLEQIVEERLAELHREVLDLRPEHDLGEELAWLLGLARSVLKPARGGAESRAEQPLARELGAGVVPWGHEPAEVRRVRGTLHDLACAGTQDRDVV